MYRKVKVISDDFECCFSFYSQNADRTFLRVTDSELFPEEDDETILQKIINTILGSLEVGLLACYETTNVDGRMCVWKR